MTRYSSTPLKGWPTPPSLATPATVHTLDSSHSPFLSMPGRLADIILES